MKQLKKNDVAKVGEVAPLAGAWIETPGLYAYEQPEQVAPLAGAWIETLHRLNGLCESQVAPLAGAWIETIIVIDRYPRLPSRPSRARGLKLKCADSTCRNINRRAPRGRVD